jgi:hypothetical protein
MAVTDVLPLDEFVDLYKMLDIAPTASEADLRERVNQLYLEAQRNIDHHNFRKRFYYQQLYEVHLPQAHQLLLDATRRAEYNRFLDAFNKGEPFPEDLPDAGGDGNGVTSGDLSRTDSLADDLIPTVGGGTTTLPSASAIAETPAATPTKPAESTPAPPATSTSPTAAPKPATPARPATPAAPRRVAPSSPSIAASAGRRVAVDIEDMERRRDHKRRELIRGELEAAGQTWGYGVGIATFILIVAIAFFTGGGKQPMILGAGVAVGITVALMAGRYALRAARRNIVAALSKMPYDELLRRCAR